MSVFGGLGGVNTAFTTFSGKLTSKMQSAASSSITSDQRERPAGRASESVGGKGKLCVISKKAENMLPGVEERSSRGLWPGKAMSPGPEIPSSAASMPRRVPGQTLLHGVTYQL